MKKVWLVESEKWKVWLFIEKFVFLQENWEIFYVIVMIVSGGKIWRDMVDEIVDEMW